MRQSSQTSQVWLKLPLSVADLAISGSRLKPTGPGPQPILVICPPGRTASSESLSVAEAPAVSMTRLAP